MEAEPSDARCGPKLVLLSIEFSKCLGVDVWYIAGLNVVLMNTGISNVKLYNQQCTNAPGRNAFLAH